MKIIQLKYLLINFSFVSIINADILAKGTIERCEVSKDSLSECKEKVLISLTVESNQSQETEKIQATMKDVKVPDGNMLLKNQYEINILKSKVVAVYPLKYMRDFESMPQEKIIVENVFSCKDGYYDSSPSCGWAKDQKGERIFDSQGYCCACSAADFFGLGSDLHRGIKCSAFNLGDGASTAHCLWFPGRWYSAYEIQQYYIYYEIKVNVYELEGQGKDQKRTLKYQLGASTTNRLVKSPDKKFLIKIIGDFFPTQPPPTHTSVYLVRPTPNRQTDNEMKKRVIEGVSNWMIIEKNQFTLDGSECNKIGVSYNGFRREPGSCSKELGSCLKNQIEHFHLRDTERIQQGKPAQNLLYKMGPYRRSWDLQTNNTQLALDLEGSMSTLITLEMDAADIKFLTMLGKGKFVIIKINNFESHSGNGIVEVQILNQGSFPAEFNVAFQCDKNVLPISGQKFYLSENQLFVYKGKVDVISDVGITNNVCNVTLKDAVDNLLDRALLMFNTTDVIRNTGNQGGNFTKDLSNKNGTQEYKSEASCDQKCPDFWDLLCHFGTQCLTNAFKTLGAAAAILGSLAGVFLMIKQGICLKIFRFIGSCCCSSSQNSEEDEEKDKKKKQEKKEKKEKKEKEQKQKKEKQEMEQKDKKQRQEMEKKNGQIKKLNNKQNKQDIYKDQSSIHQKINIMENQVAQIQKERVYANINSKLPQFKKFDFKKDFSFMLNRRLQSNQMLYQIPEGSLISQIIYKKFQNDENLVKEFLFIIQQNEDDIIKPYPLYFLID